MWPPTGLIPWFSKTEGNTYATLLHHPFLFKGKATHAQEVARRISGAVYFAFFTFTLYHKNTKNIILSYLSDLTLVSDREGINNLFIALVARFLFVCVGARDLSMASYWIDTLVLKN